MQDLGYETHNSIIVLGALGLVAVYWVLRVIFYMLVLVPFVLITKKGLEYA
jgi:hypothetical protein